MSMTDTNTDNYILVSSHNCGYHVMFNDFQKLVNSKLSEGYKLHGHQTVVTRDSCSTIYQAMIRDNTFRY